MSGAWIEVPPRRIVDIRELTSGIRSDLRITEPHFPIIGFLEHALPMLMRDFVLEICDSHEMGDNHGLTYPDDSLIRLREDVYEGACNLQGRDRFTVAHELGHLLLHRNVSGFARMDAFSVPAYRNSEWQANQFAAELLMPIEHIEKMHKPTPSDLMDQFGVTEAAAITRLKKLKLPT